MSYQSDFSSSEGWSIVDTNINLNGARGKKFRDYLKVSGVTTVIRYYASSRRDKTLTPSEARLLSSEGFSLIPVYQDRARHPDDFGAENGSKNADSAIDFAKYVGQPEGSTIFFAVDADFTHQQTERHIIPYFEAIKQALAARFRIGAYGSGHVLRRLLDEGLVEVPWISMSRAFSGTQEFFYSPDWALRQVPPSRTHASSGVTHDRNVAKWPLEALGAFRIDGDGRGGIVRAEAMDAALGGGVDGVRAAAVACFVSTEGLNLRSAPDGEILRELTIGSPVRDFGAAEVANWRRVEVEGMQGVVFGKYLRRPSTPEVEALLANAIVEWVRFKKGRANEAIDPYYKYVGEMWASIGLDYDGRSHYPNGEEVPWSAAFISYVVRRSGSEYRNFKFADAHSVFAHDAIHARILNRTDRPFWGYRRNEERPTIGDIIVRNRGRGRFTFDYAENHSRYSSHSDIVVEVTQGVARVIGGNVGDTVSMESYNRGGDNIQEYSLDSDGYLAEGQRIIALLKNRASEVA